MRKTTLAIILIFSVALFLQCGINNAPNRGNGGLSLMGRIASVALMKSTHSAASTAAVKKVLIYRGFAVADLIPIDTTGNFSVNVERRACGLVFLNGSDSVVGCLSLASGMKALPLMMVNDSISQIDMKDITIQAGVATPQHNPINTGGEIEMTANELAAYSMQSALFSTIIGNLDMNGDNVIDVLSDRPYWLQFGVWFDGGIAATSDPGNSGAKPSTQMFDFKFSDYHQATDVLHADLVTPDGVHHVNAGGITLSAIAGTVLMWGIQPNSLGSLVPGKYQISYDSDKQVVFEMASPLNSENCIVATHFWYEMAGARISMLHWKWEMLNGAAIDPTRLMYNKVYIQFSRMPGPMQEYNPTSADTVCAVDVDTVSLAGVTIFCNDLFNNQQRTGYRLR
jgi:hypothetical protein